MLNFTTIGKMIQIITKKLEQNERKSQKFETKRKNLRQNENKSEQNKRNLEELIIIIFLLNKKMNF